MEFDRRTFLHTGIVATAGALAGCSGSGSSDDDDETPTPTGGLTTDRIETIRTQAQDRQTVYRKYARFFSTEEQLTGMAERTLPDWTDLLPTPRALDAVETARTVLQNQRDLNRLEVLRLGARTEAVGFQRTPNDADEAKTTNRELAAAAGEVASAAATYRDSPSDETLTALRTALERERSRAHDHDAIEKWTNTAPGAYGAKADPGSPEAARYVKRMSTSNYEVLLEYRDQLATHLDWTEAATDTPSPSTPSGTTTPTEPTPTGGVVARDALVSRWPFESTLRDVVGGNDARADLGDVSFGEYAGRTATALDGDVGLLIDEGDNEELSIASRERGPASIGGWVYFDQPHGSRDANGSDPRHHIFRNDAEYVVDARPAGANTVELSLSITSQVAGTSYSTREHVDDEMRVPTNEWHHFVYVVDPASSVTFYLDGEGRFHDDDMPGHSPPATQYWAQETIGSWYGTGDVDWYDLLVGKLADLRIYDSALSPDEVTQIYVNTS